jgi:hypothetical protein
MPPASRYHPWPVDEMAAAKERILEGVADGVPIRGILAAEGLPSMATLFRWLDDDAAFASRYARARDLSADALDARIEALVAKLEAGEIDAQAGRVAIDALKWQAANRRPKVYGERKTVDHNVNLFAAQVEALRSFSAPQLPPVPTMIDVTPEPAGDDLAHDQVADMLA